MSAKRKPLSVEEKRTKLLELFNELGDVFTLKELEKLALKEKGIVQQSVKPVLQELVDGGQVRSEKISGSIYYWAFPSDELKTVQKQLKETEEACTQLDTKITASQSKLRLANETTEVDGYDELCRDIQYLRNQKLDLEQKISMKKNANFYAEFKAQSRHSEHLIAAVNRWTDNIFSIKTWCKEKFGKDERALDEAFGIPEEFDYFDEIRMCF